MKKKIIFLTAGGIETASSRFRVYQYIRHLEKAGFENKIISSDGKLKWIRIALLLLQEAILGKIIFIQKVVPPRTFIFILKKIANFSKARLVYDFDDALYTSPPGKKEIKINRKKLDYLIKKADLVTVGNSNLKRYVEKLNENVDVIITPIDTSKYKPKNSKRAKKVTLGWIGNPENLCYLGMISSVLKKIYQTFGNKVILKVVSSEEFHCNMKILNKKWELGDEVKDLQSFDIGLMPLKNTEWARGKCGFKIIEYMSVGIPVIVSPVGVNKEIVNHRIDGFHAKTEDDWVKYISLLIEKTELRQKMGENGRKKVMDKHSVNVIAPKFIRNLEMLLSGDQQ